MLDILSFGIFGFWVGYLILIIAKRDFGKGARIAIAAAVAVVFVAVLVGLGTSSVTGGRWGGSAALGAFWAVGITGPIVEKLRNSWAGLWLFLLFIVVEGIRTYFVMQIRM